MEICMKVNIKTIREKDMEGSSGEMGLIMLGTGSMIAEMGKELM